MNNKNKPSVVEASDAYLVEHNFSDAAYEHVNHVLRSFEFMVRLATNNALEQLIPTPTQQGEAIILQFPVAIEPKDSA